MISSLARRLVRDLAGLALPAECQVCGLPAGELRWVCLGCLDALQKLEQAPACPQCAFPLVLAGDPCPRCHGRGLPFITQIARLAVFQTPLRELILRMKYRQRWGLCRDLADRLLAREDVRCLLVAADVVVPVPLHWRRSFSRGFNQSELLAVHLTRNTNRHVVDAIRRRRHTPSQTLLRGIAARRRNVRDAFELHRPLAVAGRRVLLVDDVMTSGETLREAARALRSASPSRIDAIVLAVADPKGHDFTAL
jgi:ComF family protein